MGTRGVMGFRVDGIDKMTYNHFDSYPTCLGASIAEDAASILKSAGLNGLKDMIRKLRVVDPKTEKPSKKDIACLNEWTDLNVSEQSTSDWYCLTRNLQGKCKDTLKAGVIVDSGDFIYDSLFCEWAYIINCDDEVLEIYKGFQSRPHNRGRYSDHEPKNRAGDEYYSVALHRTIPFFNMIDLDGNFWEQLESEEVETQEYEYIRHNGDHVAAMQFRIGMLEDKLSAWDDEDKPPPEADKFICEMWYLKEAVKEIEHLRKRVGKDE